MRIAAALALAAFATALPAAEVQSSSALTLDQVRQSVLSSMDPKADPCDDFYRYACGGWLDSTKLPADQARWSRSFSVITERNREIGRELLEAAAADPGPAGTERQKIGDFYASCMDEAAVEGAGVAPLAGIFAQIDALPDGAPSKAAIARALGMSPRGLQRHLADEGTSFKDLLESARASLARSYLGEGRHSVTEIAFLLGFADTSAFSRAFKRWTGSSPRDFAARLSAAIASLAVT